MFNLFYSIMKKIFGYAMLLMVFLACENESEMATKPHAAPSRALGKRRCINDSLKLKRLSEHAQIDKINDFINEKKRLMKASGKSSKTRSPKNLTVKVIFTVLYLHQNDSLSYRQLNEQMRVLNDAFSAKNYDFQDIPSEFKAVAAGDTHIRFVHTNTRQFKTDKAIWRPYEPMSVKDGGVPINRPEKYLNIYIVPSNSDEALGYASDPLVHGDMDFDAVVITQKAFGGHLANSPSMGKSLVHEVGHYLGLEHTFGHQPTHEDQPDYDPNHCGDDGIEDTPPTSENIGNPSYPLYKTCGGISRSVMFMNYMDYCKDPTMSMFTKGQRLQMRFFAQVARKGLLKP
jgi:Pregnancy-associated plasma protein-A